MSPCPLTTNYVHALEKYVAEDIEELLYEPLVRQYIQLSESAKVAGSEIRVVQLRAFVAVEIMYYCLPHIGSNIRKYLGLRVLDMPTDPPPRSWIGLTRVAKVCASVSEDLEADRMERLIVGDDSDKHDITSLQRVNEQPTIDLASVIVEAAILLRRALRRNDAEQIPRIGTLLMRACDAVNAVPTSRVSYLRMLINTTEEQAKRPWEQ